MWSEAEIDAYGLGKCNSTLHESVPSVKVYFEPLNAPAPVRSQVIGPLDGLLCRRRFIERRYYEGHSSPAQRCRGVLALVMNAGARWGGNGGRKSCRVGSRKVQVQLPGWPYEATAQVLSLSCIL